MVYEKRLGRELIILLGSKLGTGVGLIIGRYEGITYGKRPVSEIRMLLL